MKPLIKKKIEKINSLSDELRKHKVIAVINLEGLGSKQLQSLRRDLKDLIKLIITTKNITVRAIKKSGVKNLDKLSEQLKGVCGLAFTNKNPFKLSVKLKSMTTPAPAKQGQAAPFDIIISKGPTPFAPGPIISELSDLGIKTKVKAGKLVVTEDTVIAKQGELIKPNQASIMLRLGMTPMKTGLKLIAAYEKEVVYSGKELIINLDEYRNKISNAYINAYSLAFNTVIPIKEVINALLMTAHNHARNLSLSAGLINKDNAGELLVLAQARARALASETKLEVS